MLDLQEQSKIVSDIIKRTYDEVESLETTGEFQMVKIKTLSTLERLVNELVINSGGVSYVKQPETYDFSAPLPVMMGRVLPAAISVNSVIPRRVTTATPNDAVSYEVDVNWNTGTTSNPPLALKTNPSDEDVALMELQKTVDVLFENFLQLETDRIVDEYADIEIRGVAKKAGLPVTSSKPRNALSADFIGKIKDAIRKSQTLQQEGDKGTLAQ